MLAGTMMNLPLTLDWIVNRMIEQTAHVEVISRRPDRSIHRTTYGDVGKRAQQLAHALVKAGIQRGDRVATLMWNHATHLEAYLGVPLSGAVLHTLNLRLHPDDIAFIANDAKDKYLIVDQALLPLFAKFQTQVSFEKIIVAATGCAGGVGDVPEAMRALGAVEYEEFLATVSAHENAGAEFALPRLDENDGLGCCYTSGTTGKPKGVVYTHRSTLLHSLVSALPDSLSLSRRDTLMAVVPMFHVNAWGLPYTSALVGAKQVLPGPHLDPESLLDLMERERVTVAAGVPTIWMGIRDALDAKPRDLVKGARMIVGGSAAPESLIRDFDRQGLELLHAWGMTETSPIGLVSRITPELAQASEDEQYKARAKQGVPAPLVDVKIRNDAGDVPHDGKTSGELLVRGPWIAARYATVTTPEKWTDDGYFRTGDVATIDAHGFVQLTDRVNDLIKSGGEWISSQLLENALMGHPAVREAAVVGVPHPKWTERPVAVVVLRAGSTVTPETLRAHLEPHFAKFWLPDAYIFTDAIPRTSAGKFQKTALREQYKNYQW